MRLSGDCFHFGGRALEDDLGRRGRRRRADLDDLVGRPNDRLFVLDHHDRVAPVAELPDRDQELIDVAGMQADRRLVEDVEHVDQARSQGRGQRDAPGLAAAEGPQRAIEGEIAQPDRLEVAQPGPHLIEHHAADLALPVGQSSGGRTRPRRGPSWRRSRRCCWPPIRAARASGRSRVPPQAGQDR